MCPHSQKTDLLKLNKSTKPIFLHSHQHTEFLATELTRLHRSFFVSLWWDCIWHSWLHVHVLIGSITVKTAEQNKHSLVKKVSKASQTKSQHQSNLLNKIASQMINWLEIHGCVKKKEGMPQEMYRKRGLLVQLIVHLKVWSLAQVSKQNHLHEYYLHRLSL